MVNTNNKIEPVENKLSMVIDIEKEKYKKVITAYYTNQANYDKLVITILFAEIGFLLHSIKEFYLGFFIPLCISGIGIYLALKSYKLVENSLFFEKDMLEFEMLQAIGVSEEYDNDIKEIDSNKNEIGKKIKLFSFCVNFCLIASVITTLEAFYFIKQPEIYANQLFCCLIATSVLLFIMGVVSYLQREIK